MSNRVFLLGCVWVVAAGLLTGNGTAHHVLWAFVAGMVMSVICPLGLLAWKTLSRKP